MTPGPVRTASGGHRLFARYAPAPNALGYCGPESAAVLRAVASGSSDADVTAIARQFSGAWPYQATMAGLAGIDDPLDARIGRAYWTGNDVTDTIDREQFGRDLLDTIRPQAGHYWSHLDESLLVEASPTHGFHVLGVYPWSRMLDMGRPEALHVLDSCRVTWGRVVTVGPDTLEVAVRHLVYAAGVLSLDAERVEQVGHRLDGATFIDSVDVGDHVAVHWNFVCDTLTAVEAESLERWTHWQLDAMAPRLHAQHRCGALD
ncbi:DUF6390 family protein [Aeromicrobium sp.]|uniref:DUF6390 family protein n=1 Tax=Aeromicrobium sp. TaxID=1871063 RepID=UPI00199196DF|nr:DUF6390 family protein [Aeromicrobium sp.]MBC7631838.1 hypothetical protein [Aeromicrobium sp.]